MASEEKQQPVYFGGSCACKRITYESHDIPRNCSVCHCVTCRKLSGAAYQCFPDILANKLTLYDNKETLRYSGLPHDSHGGILFLRLSNFAERAFCIDCHTPLGMRYHHDPETFGITLGSVDEGTIVSEEVRKGLAPKRHIFWSQKVWWFEGNDGLQRFERFPGDYEEGIRGWVGKSKEG